MIRAPNPDAPFEDAPGTWRAIALAVCVCLPAWAVIAWALRGVVW